MSYSYSKHQSDLSFDLLQSDFEHHPCPKIKKDSSWVSSFCYNIFFSIIAFPLAMCIGLNHIRCFVLLYFCKIERKLFLLIFCIKSTDQKKKVNIYVEIDKNHLICNTVFYVISNLRSTFKSLHELKLWIRRKGISEVLYHIEYMISYIVYVA